MTRLSWETSPQQVTTVTKQRPDERAVWRADQAAWISIQKPGFCPPWGCPVDGEKRKTRSFTIHTSLASYQYSTLCVLSWSAFPGQQHIFTRSHIGLPDQATNTQQHTHTYSKKILEHTSTQSISPNRQPCSCISVTQAEIYNLPCGLHISSRHPRSTSSSFAMRSSHLIAIGAASLASAQSSLTTYTGISTSTCTETQTQTFTSESSWTSVDTETQTQTFASEYPWTSVSTLPVTTLSSLPPPVIISSYTFSTNTTLTTLSITATFTTTVPVPTITSYSVSPTNSSATSPATVTSGNAAPNVDGLAGDSSMLGLVVFFALSFCLL